MRFGRHLAESLSAVGNIQEAEDADHQVSQTRQDLRGVLGADLGEVCRTGDVPDIMPAVFDGPMAPVQFQPALGLASSGDRLVMA